MATRPPQAKAFPGMNPAEQTAFLSSILEGSTEYAIVAKDLDGRILTWNEGARRNYGYEAPEVLGRSSLVLHDPVDVDSGQAQRYLEEARTAGMWEGKIRRVRKDGRHFTAQVTLSLRRDPQGQPIGFTMISRDLTESERVSQELQASRESLDYNRSLIESKERLEAQLLQRNEELLQKNLELEAQNQQVQQATRMKSEFLANMSHELRTPLNGIIGFAELMANGKAGPVSERHAEYLGDVLASARHLHQLINDVLDLAKVEAGKLEFRVDPLDLPKQVSEVRDVLRAVAESKGIQVETAVAAGLDGIMGDASKFKQILYNFLSNALKFTPDGGRVQIRVQPEGTRFFSMEVEDSGIGIQAADFDRLFVEFQQLDASTSKLYPGTGLGLALTKRLAEAQGGHIKVRSTPGAGSVFTVVLPRILNGPGPSGTPLAGQPRADAPTVLVVEDEPAERIWLAEVLRAEGYKVESVATGADAIQACQTRRFDALTMDILLPDMSGWQALAVIRTTERNRNIKVIVVTLAPGEDRRAGFVVDDLLLKPVSQDGLIRALRRSGLPSALGTVLVLEDDPTMQHLARIAIEGMGLRVLATADGAQALAEVAREQPAALVVDLLLPGMSGLEFILRLRREPWGQTIPVIVWTEKDLSDAERTRLLNSVQAVVAKGDASMGNLLRAIQEHGGLAKVTEATHAP